MAESAAIHCYNCDLAHHTASTGSFTSIGEMRNVKWNGYDISHPSKRHLKSDSATNEKTPGFIEPGQITGQLNYNETQHSTLFGFGRTQKWFKITLPDSSTLVCKGLLKGISIDVPEDDVITSDITIDLSGPPTFTVV